MYATLTRPIVTDYVHAVKPPWILLVLLALLAYGLPRELLLTGLLAAFAVVLAGYLIKWFRDRDEDHTADSVGPADPWVGADDTPRRVA
ncbi:MAG: hypothetical protein JWO38_2107 [Gemmataceae bacterium]|nr:hypothetical protein [Gemmataceae bacterium]